METARPFRHVDPSLLARAATKLEQFPDILNTLVPGANNPLANPSTST